MAATIDAVGTQQGSIDATAVTSFNYTGITVGSGSNRALIWAGTVNYSNISQPVGLTAVWDPTGANQSMTMVADVIDSDSTDHYFIFALRNPASGNKTLAFSWTPGNSIAGNCMSFAGVEQSSDAAAFANLTTVHLPSGFGGGPITIPGSTTSDYAVSVWGTFQGFNSPNAGSTSFLDSTFGLYTQDSNVFGLYGQGNTNTPTISWAGFGSGNTGAAAGINVKAVGAAQPPAAKLIQVRQSIKRAAYW